MAKNQNEIDIELTAKELEDLDAALKLLEILAARLPTKDKKRFVKAPENAGDWIRRISKMAQQNLGKLRRDFDPSKLDRDVKLHDELSGLMTRLDHITKALDNGIFFARSDAFAGCLNVRNQLMEAEVPGVDDNLDEGLQSFFSRSSSKPAPDEGTPPPAK